ncbi:MAG: adenylyltransferase/cytidyltransferase family protein [Candidatus Aminicenantes bacterium]
MNKLFPLKKLKKIVSQHKKAGKTIVLANGCFDLIHVGHIRYLKGAKNRGDLLVVALNSDSSVKKLKGSGRPILNQNQRAEILSSFDFVDYLCLFNEKDVSKILIALKPDIQAKGSDYTEETVPEKDIVHSYGGKVAIVGGPKVRSTSEIILEINKKQNAHT